MPGKLIPGEKKTPIYKKSSGFKMKSSPAKIYGKKSPTRAGIKHFTTGERIH